MKFGKQFKLIILKEKNFQIFLNLKYKIFKEFLSF